MDSCFFKLVNGGLTNMAFWHGEVEEKEAGRTSCYELGLSYFMLNYSNDYLLLRPMLGVLK